MTCSGYYSCVDNRTRYRSARGRELGPGNGCDDVRVDEFADQLQLSHQLGSTDNSYLFSLLYQRGLLVADSPKLSETHDSTFLR